MRRNGVLILVLLGLAAIGGLVLVRPKQTVSQSPLTPKPASDTALSGTKSADTASTASSGAAHNLEPASQPGMAAADFSSTNDSPLDSPEARHQAYVDARTAELMDLGMNDDSQSLNTILSELSNRDPEIRKAAVEATVQFGSRDAIPNLTDAAAQTDDPQEKAEIMEAIQFLKLPTLSEAAAQANQAQPAIGSNGPAGGPRR